MRRFKLTSIWLTSIVLLSFFGGCDNSRPGPTLIQSLPQKSTEAGPTKSPIEKIHADERANIDPEPVPMSAGSTSVQQIEVEKLFASDPQFQELVSLAVRHETKIREEYGLRLVEAKPEKMITQSGGRA